MRELILIKLEERITAEDEDVRLKKFRQFLVVFMNEEESDAISDKLALLSLFPSIRKPLETEAKQTMELCLSKLSDGPESLALEEIILSQEKKLVEHCLMKEIIHDIHQSGMNRIMSSEGEYLDPH